MAARTVVAGRAFGRLPEVVAGAGCAAWLIRLAAWRSWSWPRISAVPCSVITADIWNDVTGAVTSGTIVEVSARGCQERSPISA